jgi:hypothetical protein
MNSKCSSLFFLSPLIRAAMRQCDKSASDTKTREAWLAWPERSEGNVVGPASRRSQPR